MLRQAIRHFIRWDRLPAPRKDLIRYRLAAVLAHLVCLLPIPLPRLFQWFGSDKQLPGAHSYGSAYQLLFRARKYRRVRLLEIGIGGDDRYLGGHSLVAWLAFFPFGHIYGADINDKSALAGWRRSILHLDQGSASQLAALAAQTFHIGSAKTRRATPRLHSADRDRQPMHVEDQGKLGLPVRRTSAAIRGERCGGSTLFAAPVP